MEYKNFGRLSVLTFMLVYLNGCGGTSTPKEDTNITEVNTTTVLEKEEKVDLIPIVKEEVLVEDNTSKASIETGALAPTVGEAETVTIEETTPPKEEEKQEDNITESNTTVKETTPAKEENNETQEETEEEPVVIPNTPPVVDAKDDKSVEVNQNITITAEATDSDGEIVSQRWSDENNNTLSSELSFEYSNSEVGIYTLTFTATDDNGASASDNMDVNVTEVVEECDPLAELLGAC